MKIIPFKSFVKDVKKLKKRYKSILKDIELFKKELEINPTMGIALGHGIFKVRVKNSDKNRHPSQQLNIFNKNINKRNRLKKRK